MATIFDRWAKDPFFAAAEEVQESSDRLASVHRRWIQHRRDADLRRDLHTALGTAKWQLEELERAVASNDEARSAGDETVARHRQFVSAMAEKVLTVETSLMESNLEDGAPAMSWVDLDEGEYEELARFLTCRLPDMGKGVIRVADGFDDGVASSPSHSTDSTDSREERPRGHRRVASASAAAEIGDLSILISGGEAPRRSLDERPPLLLPRALGFTRMKKAVDSATKLRWCRSGFSKWKGGCRHDEVVSLPLQSKDVEACCERSKSCLSGCDEFDDKHLSGCSGALYRQLQRSQYHIRYGRPVQIIAGVVLTVLLIGNLFRHL